ncbi:unnamed protein product [Pieris macdunnoughi]|uniref:Uncharacterized protein n=1 Tax=Pieris macdunnoughi TaxID=345717 RepID=A0A821X9Y0_9NEOP|nr:unnamed protein product [Pieris macdunnoughi]
MSADGIASVYGNFTAAAFEFPSDGKVKCEVSAKRWSARPSVAPRGRRLLFTIVDSGGFCEPTASGGRRGDRGAARGVLRAPYCERATPVPETPPVRAANAVRYAILVHLQFT